jgi:DNA-binding NtrC family response regulator|tara:strand:+ start:1143 stop:1841 length:699 start_codon:yes stop_codon:yes gene_type:complete
MKFAIIMKLLKWLMPNSNPKLNHLKELTQEEFEKARFKARIAFIDDEEIAHVERLREDGYNIATFSDIDNIDDFIRKKYHVVILDIQGVGQNISPKSEGWGILRYLKGECPNLVVIMYTGAEWSITKYKAEADQADDFIGKDLEFLDFKSKLDNGIRKAFSPKFHFEVEKKTLTKEISNSQTLQQIKTILDNYGGDKKTAIDQVKRVTQNKVVIESINKFLTVIVSLKKLIE